MPFRPGFLAQLFRAFALCAALPAAAQEVPDFTLDLDTGGHRATVRAMVVSADGSLLVSASDDKTVRVWDWQAGTTRTILRGQVGPGAEGIVNAVALSPDARQAAVAGYFNEHLAVTGTFGDVRIFDTETGRIVRVLKGYTYVVGALAHDPVTDVLAVAGQGGRVHRWQAPFGEADPVELPPLPDTEASFVRHLAFALGGSRLIATTDDFGLRIWDTETDTDITPADAEPLWDVELTALAVSPDGTRFAVAGWDGRVELRDAATGGLVSALPTQPFRPYGLAFTADGTQLAVGCGYSCGTEHRSAVWDLASGATVAEHRGHDGGVVTMVALPQAGLIASSGGRDRAIRIWQPTTGAETVALASVGAPVSAVGIDAAGQKIGWGPEDPCPAQPNCPKTLAPLAQMFELPTANSGIGKPEPFADTPPPLARATLELPGVGVSVSEETPEQFAGVSLEISRGKGRVSLDKTALDGFYHSSYTLTERTGWLISGGGNGILIAYDQGDGGFVGEFVGHTGDILSLATANGVGRLLSGSADQTLKLWDLATQELIVSMFFAGEEWVVWTPQGYYDSSPAGDRFVGWHINQGPDREARFITARQLRRHLHSPEIVRRAIVTGDPGAAARELRGTDAELAELLSRPAPEFTVQLAEDVSAPPGFATFEIVGDSVDVIESWGYSVMIDDRRVPIEQVPDPTAANRKLYRVPVKEGRNEISVRGENEDGYITERAAEPLMVEDVPEPTQRLFVAAVGINDYPLLPTGCRGRSCDLAYPVADALGLLDAIREKTAPLYASMETLVIVSPSALEQTLSHRETLTRLTGTSAAIEPVMPTIQEELQDFLKRAGPDDTTIVFLAGHGLNINEDYYLLAANGARSGQDWDPGGILYWGELQSMVNDAKGRRIMIIDTCHAAGAFNEKLNKQSSDDRIHVLAATASDNVAQEDAKLGHGVFTYALIEGLRGEAQDWDENVRILGLTDYIFNQVMRRTKGKQEPLFPWLPEENILIAGP